MRILIEGYKYAATDVKEILRGIDALENVDGEVVVNYVGYYYNTHIKDCVFILPKVLLKGERVFGNYPPEQLLHLDTNNPLTEKESTFIYEFAVWIYRAIVVFRDSHKDSDIVYYKKIAQIGRGSRQLSNTYLDILLELLRFNRENQNFFFFVLRNLHSGYNKINWARTISHSNAVVQNESPVYLNPVNKKRQINFDEELLVIYYSILNYIGDRFGFPKEINCNFDLIKGKPFEHYLQGYGKTRLRQIKYKYFSDKALQLWELCNAFFEKTKQVHINTEQKEYLLVKNFYVVFEAIIDELVGDKKDELPADFKEQKDGKLVDHLYTYPGLIEADDKQQTYYIGDSKYYKIDGDLGDTSIYKQYTYARNIVQYNIDLWLDDNVPDPEVRLRDDVTEGYNVIPNFFISAAMKEGDYSYNHDEVTPTKISGKNSTEIKFQFRDRLFDRDTMLLSRYNVNFLFVVALYARNRQTEKDEWKKKVRKQFREQIREVLAKQYGFYAITAREGVDDVQQLQGNFHQLIGKVFAPFKEGDDGQRYYSLALEKEESCAEENERVMELLKPLFHIVECPMGTDPQEVLPKVEQKRVTVREDEAESSGKGPYLLSSVDKNVNADIKEIAEGKASCFISGYSMLLAGIDFRQIKYFAAVIDHLVAGYYRVESYDVFNATEILEEAKKTGSKQYQGYDKPYRVKLVLGDYTPLEAPFTYGIDRNASKGVAMSAKVFKEYCKKGVQTSQ